MIYLAGPCDSENRTMMVKVANQLRREGLEVYCPWELKIENAWGMTQEAWGRKVFEADIAAIQACDAMILISIGRNSTAGTNFENGYAYALGKSIHIVQITDAPASLMTYCGCSTFIAGSARELESSIQWIADTVKSSDGHYYKRPCDVVLT